MRLVSVNRCEPGQKLARSIFASNGTVLLGEGVVLTQRMLNRLKQANITAIYIEDERTADVSVEDVISEATRREAMGTIHAAFAALRDDPHKWQKNFASQEVGRRLYRVMNDVVDELRQKRSALNLLGSTCAADHYVFSHSLHVALYATALGIELGFGRKELVEAGIGAILHDVGKMAIPCEILTKPGKLTDDEQELMKQHTVYGFELLRRQEEIPLLAAHCAYQHHERCDGSGYPRGLTGGEIHPYAKLVAVCDVFDAMTENRVYRPAVLPHEAMEVLYAGADKLFDKHLVEAFRNTIALYPIGLTVTLNTGEVGVVVDTNKGAPSRPVVRIVRDGDGQPVAAPYEYDLSKRLHLMIVATDALL